jgi:hypothetical protein
MSATPGYDERIAVGAHRLLGALTLIVGNAELLRRHWAEMDVETFEGLIADVEERARFLTRQFELLARGLPIDLSADLAADRVAAATPAGAD